MQIKLTKIKSLLEGAHPNNIEEGYVKIGRTNALPMVGQSLYMTNDTTWFVTSEVVEIIDEFTFKTLNSIYKWEEIKEQLALN